MPLLAALSFAVAAASAPVRADDPCPGSREYASAYDRLSRDPASQVDQVLSSANVAAASLDQCAAGLRAAGNVAGGQYAAIRAAQYRLVAGRLLRATGRAAEAKNTLVAALDGVEGIDDRSLYREAAVSVRDAVQGELAKLGAPAETR